MKGLGIALLLGLGTIWAPAATDSPSSSIPVVSQQMETVDSRDWNHGTTMYGDGTTTVDQPYVVVMPNGRWLAVATTRVTEGIPCNLSVWWSDDKGKTWTWKKSIEIDKNSAWGTPYLTSYGRVYVFYQVQDRITKYAAEWAFKYSDDNGETWSKRHYIPTRLTTIDGTRGWWAGWSVDKPKLFRNQLFMAFTKNFSRHRKSNYNEGWYIVCTNNIETEKDPDKLTWETRPDGMVGLRDADLSKHVSAEHNTVPLKEGLYCTARSYAGYILDSYSFDQGKTWSAMKPAPYNPDFPERIIKNPMANCNMWKCKNGKYLMWFHNHATGGESKMRDFPWVKENGRLPYPNRNPVWITGGIEKNNKIYWSEPEILLYDADYAKFYLPHKQYVGVVGGFSYPDMIELDGKFWFTETEKTFARLHPVDPSLIQGLWNPEATVANTKKALIFETKEIPVGGIETTAPVFSNLSSGGFAIETMVNFKDLSPGQVLLDTREGTKGILLATDKNQVVTLSIGDGKITNYWSLDKGLLKPNTDHHIVFVVDGGPDVISVIVDGVLCDGGKTGRQGWGHFSRELLNVNGAAKMQVATSGTLKMKQLSIYNRYLRTAEAIGRYRNPEGVPASQ